MTGSLEQLFHTTLKDVYYAERHLLKALPKMARASAAPELREALLAHRDETQGQIERLQQVFEALNRRAQGTTCEAIDGITSEFEELMEEFPEPSPVRDAGVIACGQAAEHYEIARYGTLVAWAKALDMRDAAKLLEETLQEEKAADKLLNQLAAKGVNVSAARAA